jgi:hypothetical protein
MLEMLIQLLLLDSYWLIEGFELEEQKRRIFPVDYLTNVEPNPSKKS